MLMRLMRLVRAVGVADGLGAQVWTPWMAKRSTACR